MRNHVVITGTGRAGTSFLVQLLTLLGCDTGFDLNALKLFPHARAGLELDIRVPNAPYIVKSPLLCDYIDDVLGDSSIRIEHALIPVRQFEAAAASRAHVQMLTTGSVNGISVVGGLWHTETADEQIPALRMQFTKLIESLVRHDVPMSFLWYLRIVQDPDYLYGKINFLLKDRDLAAFKAVFEQVARPEWVNRFTPDDR